MNIEGMNLYDYWRILNKRKWPFIGVFIVNIFAVIFYTSITPKIYSSSAVIKIQPPRFYTRIPGSDIMDINPWGSVNTELRIITSLEIAKKVVLKLNLVKSNNESDINSKALEIQSKYKAERVPDTNLISITAYAENPYFAYDIVSAVINAYKEYDLEQKSAQAKKLLMIYFNEKLKLKIN